jgi:hypothetical protein
MVTGMVARVCEPHATFGDEPIHQPSMFVIVLRIISRQAFREHEPVLQSDDVAPAAKCAARELISMTTAIPDGRRIQVGNLIAT